MIKEYKHYKEIQTPDGLSKVTTEVEKVDRYGMELINDNLIFIFNEKRSKPVQVVKNSSWSWKKHYNTILSYYTPKDLYKELSDDLWSCSLYNFCKVFNGEKL